MILIEAKHGEPIRLGREGENNARRIIFSLIRCEKLYGPGVAQLIVQRTGETTPYPVALTLEGSNVIWTVTAADTAIPGTKGKAELRYYVGDTLAKSETWGTIVLDALGKPSETPPEPQKDWVDQVLDAAKRAEDAAKRAEDAAASGGGGGTGGTGNVSSAEIDTIVVLDQDEFDALTERPNTTLYTIRG